MLGNEAVCYLKLHKAQLANRLAPPFSCLTKVPAVRTLTPLHGELTLEFTVKCVR